MPDTNNLTNPFAVPPYHFEHMVERHVRYLLVHNEDFRRMDAMIGAIRHDVDELIAGRIGNQTNPTPNVRNPGPPDIGTMVSVSQLRETMDLLRDLKRTADNINVPRIESEMFRLAGLGANVTPDMVPWTLEQLARAIGGAPAPVGDGPPVMDQIIADAERTVQAETRAAITPQTDVGPPY